MGEAKSKTLRAGLRKATTGANDQAPAKPAKSKPITERKKSLSAGLKQATAAVDEEKITRNRNKQIVAKTNPLAERYERLRDVPRTVIRKAWFTMAHLVLEPNATIVDMGCQDGTMVYAMAALSPQCQFIGVDMNPTLIDYARETYRLPNLDFICGDVGAPDLFNPESLDAIVNSFLMHEIYSGSHYNDRSVVQTLQNQFTLLKPDGLMMLRDFAMPADNSYVLLEMPDVKSQGNDLAELSEADLLVWYSEHARPRQDPGCMGFFLEELPARFPKTRLFRLPSKWAYEFLMRKDERERWEDELPKEYTFFTEHEYRKTLRALGNRVLYTAPHWDEQYVKTCFDGHFRLYDENWKALGTPPTSFIAVAQKIGENGSLLVNERRSRPHPGTTLRIQPMRNDKTGRVVDVIARDVSLVEILPWRMSESGDLNIFLHTGAPRGIVNYVPRNGPDLDGKRWSGHMTEAIAVSAEIMSNIAEDDASGAARLLKDVIGLTPVANRTLEKGPAYYPAPDFIDERIETRFIEVQKPEGRIEPRILTRDLEGFQSKGRVVELSAQAVLNAISVGMIPNAQLEVQILALCERLNMKAETWVDSPLALPEVDVPRGNIRDLLAKIGHTDDRYKPARGGAGQWRMLQSVFVEEGNVNGALTGLASRDIDFVISEEHTENIAVVLPLVRSMSGEVLAGYVAEYLPVPQRHKGTGLSVSAPMLPLPRDITTMDAARHYIADHFKVKIENVTKLGESYFSHLGVTPQRIYPFALTAPVHGNSGLTGMGAYAPLAELWKLMYWDNSKSFAYTMSLAYKCLGENSDLSPTHDFSQQFSTGHDHPMSAHAADLRGLGSETASGSAGGKSGGNAVADHPAFDPAMDADDRDRLPKPQPK